MSLVPVTSGDVKSIEQRLSAKGRRVFTVKGWNDALRQAGIYAAKLWVNTYAPKRWHTDYAVGQLGYSAAVGKSKKRRMRKGERPFWSTGDLNNAWATRARVGAKATKGHVRFYAAGPSGWLSHFPLAMASFKAIPPQEAAAIAQAFRRGLIMAVQTGRADAHKSKMSRAAAKAQKKADARARKTAMQKASRAMKADERSHKRHLRTFAKQRKQTKG
jgi:hypothetical protein